MVGGLQPAYRGPISAVLSTAGRPIGPAFPGAAGGIASTAAPTFAVEPARIATSPARIVALKTRG